MKADFGDCGRVASINACRIADIRWFRYAIPIEWGMRLRGRFDATRFANRLLWRVRHWQTNIIVEPQSSRLTTRLRFARC
jgi:hypothetical protein